VPSWIVAYVRGVTAVNRVVGRAMMWMIFVMMGVLLYSTLARSLFDRPPIWAVEVSQFLLAGYYLLGGGYTLQSDAHVRMDLLYSRWSIRGQGFADSLTAFALVFYLTLLLLGGLSSTAYAFEYDQRNFTAWRPPLAPVKTVMVIGVALMWLQAIALFFRDVARARGEEIL
jgi:TRAP-type mannitol/chloroaromatic compound transport system permease small subunit